MGGKETQKTQNNYNKRDSLDFPAVPRDRLGAWGILYSLKASSAPLSIPFSPFSPFGPLCPWRPGGPIGPGSPEEISRPSLPLSMTGLQTGQCKEERSGQCSEGATSTVRRLRPCAANYLWTQHCFLGTTGLEGARMARLTFGPRITTLPFLARGALDGTVFCRGNKEDERVGQSTWLCAHSEKQ